MGHIGNQKRKENMQILDFRRQFRIFHDFPVKDCIRFLIFFPDFHYIDTAF